MQIGNQRPLSHPYYRDRQRRLPCCFRDEFKNGIRLQRRSAASGRPSHSEINCETAPNAPFRAALRKPLWRDIYGIEEKTVSSEIPGSPSADSTAEAPHPCAFYITEMIANPRRDDAPDAASGRSSMRHRCLLNPGRAHGPDGNGIGLGECSLERQSLCQSCRRADLARLNATLPIRAPV